MKLLSASILPKIPQCREMIDHLQLPVLLEVDGGVSRSTIDDLVETCADVFVSGSAVFGGTDYAQNIRALKECMKSRCK